jgi:hypothetical protein
MTLAVLRYVAALREAVVQCDAFGDLAPTDCGCNRWGADSWRGRCSTEAGVIHVL